MSTEPFIGEIKILGFSFAPIGYQACNGQLLSIAENTALFSLIGTIYGGDGRVTFSLPDLRGRTPIHQGDGPGLPEYAIGEVGGNPNATLLTTNMPAHSHAAIGINVRIPVTANSEDSVATNQYIGNATSDTFGPTPSPTASLGAPIVSGNTAPAGGGQSFSIQNPYLTVNYSIAVEGIFPSRN